MKKQVDYSAYLYILPAFILFSVYVAYPIIYNVYLSLLKWDGISSDQIFIGLKNYLSFFNDKYFFLSIRNVFYWLLLTTSIQMSLGLILANSLWKQIFGRNTIKAIAFAPCMIMPVIIGVVFGHIFETFDGILNQSLRSIGLAKIALSWLADPSIAIFTLIAINIWQWTGFSMVMYLAGMTNIPTELYEAAHIDGASSTRRFFSLTVPLLRNTHLSLIVLHIIGTLRTFDLVWIISRGGPAHTTEVIATYLFRVAFFENRMGYAGALSVFLLFLAMTLTIVQIRLYTRRDRVR